VRRLRQGIFALKAKYIHYNLSNYMALEGRMAQSRRRSLIEALTNTVVGYALAVATQFAVFPVFGLRVDVVENLGLGLIFTTVSLARGYVLRRLFERWRL
jgi:hypothetical protein